MEFKTYYYQWSGTNLVTRSNGVSTTTNIGQSACTGNVVMRLFTLRELFGIDKMTRVHGLAIWLKDSGVTTTAPAGAFYSLQRDADWPILGANVLPDGATRQFTHQFFPSGDYVELHPDENLLEENSADNGLNRSFSATLFCTFDPDALPIDPPTTSPPPPPPPPPPPSGSWHTIYDTATTTPATGLTGIGVRNWIDPAAYITPPDTASKIRVTFSAVGGSGDLSLTGYAGQSAASGDAYDFDGNQVELKVSGSGSISVTSGTTVVSDEATLAWDKTKPTIISLGYVGDNQAYKGGLGSNFNGYYKSGAAGEVGTTDVTGYTAGVGNVYAISKIEVFG